MHTPSLFNQFELEVDAVPRGAHLITSKILNLISDSITKYEVGICNLFLQHTSAALTINENADPDVRSDIVDAIDRLAPERSDYAHDAEGPDDMPAHVVSSVLGCSLNVPIRGGKLALGTWQGIYLVEWRRRSSPRHILITVQGHSR